MINWNNLKNMKCPKCRERVAADIFKISMEKFNKIVDSLYKPKPVVIDNQFELNNLGTSKIAEDFSDSKVLENL